MISQDLYTLWLVLEVSEEESETFHYYLVSVSKTNLSFPFFLFGLYFFLSKMYQKKKTELVAYLQSE